MRHLRHTVLSSLLVLCGFSLAAPPPTLFGTPWDDLGIFTNDLVPARQGDLSALAGAPVYHLELTLQGSSSTAEEIVSGKMEVRFTNTTHDLLDDLVFRLYPNALGAAMTVNSVRVDGRAVTVRLGVEDTALRVPLALSLLPGEDVVVSMDFAVSLPATPAPQPVAYGRLAQYENVLSLADIYPTLSVFRDGAWEVSVPDPAGDPLVAEAGFYLVRVRAPESLQLVTTGRLTEETVVDGQKTAVFAAGPARDFYLAAATGYTLLSRVVGDTVVNAHVPADLVSGGERTLEVAARALELFSKFTPYPYRELDLVAVPVTAGGIEYPGLVNLANSLYNDRSGTLASVVAHEVAHQWSFNLVGSDQIEEPWLDESLAQYLTLLYHREYDTERFVDGYLQNWRGLWRAAPDPDKAVGLPVAAYDRDYSAIVYGRGLFFYAALEARLGRETVEAVLQTYYTRYAWDFVTTDDLRNVAEEVCACELSDLFEVWIGE